MNNQQKIEKAICNGNKVQILVHTVNLKHATAVFVEVDNVPGLCEMSEGEWNNIDWHELIKDYGMKLDSKTRYRRGEFHKVDIYSL